MADVNVTDLTQETYSTMDGTEQVIMFDSAEGKRATVAAVGEYVLKKLTTSLNGSTQTVANALSSLNSELTPEDFSSQITHTGSNASFYKIGKICYIMFQSAASTHSADEEFFTLPSGYRPRKNTFTPFVINGLTIGTINITTAGIVKIGFIGDTTVSGRVYFDITYVTS